MPKRLFNDVAGGGGSSNGLDDDVDLGVAHHVPPFAGTHHGATQRRQFFLVHCAAAHCPHLQREPEFLFDRLGIAGQDLQRPETNISKPDYGDCHLHLRPTACSSAHPKWLMITTVWAAPAEPYYFAWAPRQCSRRKTRHNSRRQPLTSFRFPTPTKTIGCQMGSREGMKSPSQSMSRR